MEHLQLLRLLYSRLRQFLILHLLHAVQDIRHLLLCWEGHAFRKRLGESHIPTANQFPERIVHLFRRDGAADMIPTGFCTIQIEYLSALKETIDY